MTYGIDSVAKSVEQMFERSTSQGMWWSKEGDELPGAVFSEMNAITMCSGSLYYDIYANNTIYQGNPTYLYGDDSYYRDVKLCYNVTASCVDALTAKICKNPVSIQYLANHSDFDTKKKAKNLQRYMQGWMEHIGMNEYCKNAFVDMVISGNGFIHLKIKNGKIIPEQIPAKYVRGLFTNSSTGDPESIHLVKLVDKFTLCDEYPEYAGYIMNSVSSFPYMLMDTNPFLTRQYTVVIESYSKYAKRHTVCVNNKTLLDEPWDLTDENGDVIFPIAVCKYKPSNRLFFCKGAVGEVRTLQLTLNSILTKTIHAAQMVCTPKVLVPEGCDIDLINIDNTIDAVKFRGAPPVSWQLGMVPKDNYVLIDMLANDIRSVFGMTQMSSQGEKPAGLDSGEALKTMVNIESDRFMMAAQSWESLFMQVNDLVVRLNNHYPELATKSVLYVGKNFQEQIKWKDCNLDRDKFLMKPFPVSMLPQTPEGKIDTVERLIAMGIMNPQQAKVYLDMPDVENYYDYENSDFDSIDMLIAKCIEGEEAYPTPALNITLALERTRQAYLHYQTQGLYPENLDLLQKLINRLVMMHTTKTTLQQQIAAEAQQAQMQQQMAGNGGQPSMGKKNGMAVQPQPSSVTMQAALGQ